MYQVEEKNPEYKDGSILGAEPEFKRYYDWADPDIDDDFSHD